MATLTIVSVSLALIYGSYAKERMRPASDIDLLVVCGTRRSEELLLKELPLLERKLQREINYKLYLDEEFRKLRPVDPFLGEVLRGKHIVIKGTL